MVVWVIPAELMLSS